MFLLQLGVVCALHINFLLLIKNFIIFICIYYFNPTWPLPNNKLSGGKYVCKKYFNLFSQHTQAHAHIDNRYNRRIQTVFFLLDSILSFTSTCRRMHFYTICTYIVRTKYDEGGIVNIYIVRMYVHIHILILLFVTWT